MKMARLTTFVAFALSHAVEARAQSFTPVDSAQAIFGLVKGNRAGISSDQIEKGQSPAARSSADSSHFNVRAHLVHAFNGTVLGAFSGAAIGGLVGLSMDAHAGDDAMIPAYALLAYFGVIIGAGVGFLAGAFWPTK